MNDFRTLYFLSGKDKLKSVPEMYQFDRFNKKMFFDCFYTLFKKTNFYKNSYHKTLCYVDRFLYNFVLRKNTRPDLKYMPDFLSEEFNLTNWFTPKYNKKNEIIGESRTTAQVFPVFDVETTLSYQNKKCSKYTKCSASIDSIDLEIDVSEKDFSIVIIDKSGEHSPAIITDKESATEVIGVLNYEEGYCISPSQYLYCQSPYFNYLRNDDFWGGKSAELTDEQKVSLSRNIIRDFLRYNQWRFSCEDTHLQVISYVIEYISSVYDGFCGNKYPVMPVLELDEYNRITFDWKTQYEINKYNAVS